MAYIEGVLQEEYDRLISKKLFYENNLSMLPKGSIQKKNINGKQYQYLCYREKGKVITQYIPPEKLEKLQSELNQYQQIKKALKNINENIKILKKVIKHA